MERVTMNRRTVLVLGGAAGLAPLGVVVAAVIAEPNRRAETTIVGESTLTPLHLATLLTIDALVHLDRDMGENWDR